MSDSLPSQNAPAAFWSLGERLFIPLKLPLSPLRIFTWRIKHTLDVTVEHSQHADTRYDCNPILGGGDDVVTRSHENLLSTVRGTSRCKARLREASMPSLNSQRQSNRGISRSEIIGTLLVQVLVLLGLLVAVVRYLEWSSDANQAEFMSATKPSASDPNHSGAAPLYQGPYFPLL